MLGEIGKGGDDGIRGGGDDGVIGVVCDEGDDDDVNSYSLFHAGTLVPIFGM